MATFEAVDLTGRHRRAETIFAECLKWLIGSCWIGHPSGHCPSQGLVSEWSDRMDAIADLESLHAHFGATSTISAQKVMPRLDRYSRAFIALSPFLVLATADGDGGVDASPRGDAPGFVAMPDDTTLIVPDRPGNRRVDSFANVIRHPGIGLIFLVPGFDETLRVNGTGRLTTDAVLLAPLEAQGKIPATGLLVSITEVFFHCGKALIRSKLSESVTSCSARQLSLARADRRRPDCRNGCGSGRAARGGVLSRQAVLRTVQ